MSINNMNKNNKVEKFDVNTLQPFDKVLTRVGNSSVWSIDLFGFRRSGLIYGIYSVKPQCIPYNDETKHLIGTTNDCPDYYKWWEE